MNTENSLINDIRVFMRKRRMHLGIGAQYRAAQALAKQLQVHPEVQKSQQIACYWAVGGELSCRNSITQLWRLGKQCYLPVIDFSADVNTMTFRQYRPGDRLVPNRYGIPEPVAGRYCVVDELDCVLTPLVAFDNNGNRIGMGGGFYDRAFARCKHTVLLGMAYRFQQVSMIKPQAWDVPLDDVIAV